MNVLEVKRYVLRPSRLRRDLKPNTQCHRSSEQAKFDWSAHMLAVIFAPNLGAFARARTRGDARVVGMEPNNIAS